MPNGVNPGEQIIRVRIEDVSAGAVPGMGGKKGPTVPTVPGMPLTLPKVMADTFQKVGGIMKGMGKITLAVMGIASIVGILKGSKIIGAFGNAFLTLLSAFIDVMLMPFIPFLSGLINLLLPLIPAMMTFFDNPAKVLLVGLGAIIGGSVGGILGGLAGRALGALIGSAIGGKIGGILGGALGSLAGPLGTVLGAIAGAIIGGLIAVGIGKLIEKWDDVKGWFVDISIKIADFFKGPFVNFWVAIGSALAQFFSGPFVDFWVAIGGAISHFFSGTFVDFWVEIGRAIAHFFSGTFVDFWVEVGRAIARFFTGTIPSFWGMVTDALKNFFGSIGKLFSFQAGTPFVPRDMLAVIHRGEAIIPARQNTFTFFQNFTYSSPTSYIAGRDMGAGFRSNVNASVLRMA